MRRQNETRATTRAWLLAGLLAAALLGGAALVFQPPAWVYPGLAVLLFLFYANTVLERVPLYLTNATTRAALAELIVLEHRVGDGRRRAIVDLGCGLGGTVAYLARRFPDWDVWGVETAPGSFLAAWIRALGIPNAHVRFQSLWSVDLSAFDVAYAFLSPAPMPRLHAKIKAEMKPGALFVSNSFWADGEPYDGIADVADGRATKLFFSKH